MAAMRREGNPFGVGWVWLESRGSPRALWNVALEDDEAVLDSTIDLPEGAVPIAVEVREVGGDRCVEPRVVQAGAHG